MSNERDRTVLRRWFETSVLTLGGCAVLGWLSHAEVVREVAAWSLLLPLLCGAQHGMLFGLFSAGALCALPLFVPSFELAAHPTFNLVYLSAGSLAGVYRDFAERRCDQAEEHARALSIRLQRLERAFCALQLSHVELEQRFATDPSPLAGVLHDFKRRARKLTSLPELAEMMLEVLASRAQLQAASLYPLARTRVSQEALASLGNVPAGAYEHPLVERAADSGRLVTVIDAELRAQADGAVVAAIPLRSSSGRIGMMLAVHQLPFEAFHADALRALYALALELIDLIEERCVSRATGDVAVRHASGYDARAYAPEAE